MRLIPAAAALLLLLTTGLALSPDSPPSTDPRRATVAELSALLGREPHHVGALYYGARVLAAIGDNVTALKWLDQLERVGLGDELNPDDFGPLAQTDAFQQRLRRFAVAAPPVGKTGPLRELAMSDVLPEGTAWDPRRRELLISSGRRRTVMAVNEAGTVRELAPPADGGMLAVLGMTVDPTTDLLWVATSAAPFMQSPQPSEQNGARLACIDLAQGRVLKTYPLAGQVMLNDLSLAPDGSVYVTESLGGTVYRLKPGGEDLEAVLPAGSFEGANGIVSLGAPGLLVADFHGLSLVRNPAGPELQAQRLRTPDGLYLGGIDGLAVFGNTVIGVQNLIGRGRIWSLTVDPKEGRVATAELLVRGHPDFLNPTTGVVAGETFQLVVDPQLQTARPDGTLSPLPLGRIGHRVLSLPLRPSE